MSSDGKDFWNWSLQVYGKAGVEDALLRLQNELGLNVNIVLWCCWCSELFEEMPEIVIRKAIEETAVWSKGVTTPLRSARLFLRSYGGDNKFESLRERIKSIELEAEKVEQDVLSALAARSLIKRNALADKAKSIARRALVNYAALAQAPSKKGFSVSLLESALDFIFTSETSRISQEPS